MTTLRSLVSTLSIAICLSASWPCTAKESVSQDDLSTQKEFLQAKLDANKELAQKDIELLNKRFDAVDKRIDDQVSRVSDIGNSVDRFSTIIGVIGTLVTVLLTLGGLIGYYSVVAKVRETAQETAKTWLQENEKELRSRTDTLHSDAQKAITTTLEGVNNSASEAKAAMERAQKDIGRTQPDAPITPESRKDTEALQRRSEELKSIPENSYSFDDWNTRAFAAYNAGQLERAALYWENAAKNPAADAENSARALFNQGLSLGQLHQHDAAIAAFDQLISRYTNDTSSALREQVAKAMVNKGATHGEMGDNDKAIATCEQVIDAYRSDTAPTLREQVTRALNGKGFILLLSAKEQLVSGNGHQANQLLQKGETDLQAAVERKPQWGISLGNLAYTQWLLKRPTESEAIFRNALTAKDGGGEHLYKTTLDDIALHPIPEDAAFREMVVRLWTEFQASKPSES